MRFLDSPAGRFPASGPSRRDIAAAESASARWLEQHPDDRPALARAAYLRALRAMRARDRNGAVEALQEALDAEPTYAPARRALAAVTGG